MWWNAFKTFIVAYGRYHSVMRGTGNCYNVFLFTGIAEFCCRRGIKNDSGIERLDAAHRRVQEARGNLEYGHRFAHRGVEQATSVVLSTKSTRRESVLLQLERHSGLCLSPLSIISPDSNQNPERGSRDGDGLPPLAITSLVPSRLTAIDRFLTNFSRRNSLS